MILVAGCLGVCAQAICIPPENIEVRASSILQTSTAPHNVVDMDHNAKWSSNYDVDEPQWIELVFPQEIDFTGLKICWFGTHTRAETLQLNISMDGEDWVEIVDFDHKILSPGNMDQISFPDQPGRYLRVNMSNPVGLVYSISSIEVAGIEYNDPFVLHVGLGSGEGEAYLQSEGERLRLDVMIPIYTNTFTKRFGKAQEYLEIKDLVNYRDFVEQVIGHNMQQTYHLVVSDELLKRNDIQEMDPNGFWLSSGNVWNNLKKFNINPSDYDLVWSLWAWENSPEAFQQYGGAAHTGPDETPFMSFSVSTLSENSEGILMVLAHEAQHTYESLFYNTGGKVVLDPPIDGFTHADRQPQLLEAILDLEPGLFEPWKSKEEALKHREGGSLQYPGKTMQLTVDAWTHRQQPRERYIKIADRYGELVPARGNLVVEPLFSSISIVTDTEYRQVYLPVRVRDRGLFVDLDVTAKIGDQIIGLEKDTYTRHENIRLPRQVRWSIGWDGHSFYGNWIPITKEDTTIEVTVSGDGIYEVFEIPIEYLVVQDENTNILEYIDEQTNIVIEDGITRFTESSSVIYKLPMTIFESGLVGFYLELTGNGFIGLKANMPGVFSSNIWTDELNNESVAITIPRGILQMFKEEEYMYLELEMPRFRPNKYKSEPWFELSEFSILGKSYY